MMQQQTNTINKASWSEGEKVPDIQSLTLRAQDLTRSVDAWNTAMIWVLVLAAMAAIAVVVVTRIVLTRAKQLADVQEELIRAKDKQLALDLKDKDLKISEAGEKAATAETKAEGFRLDIAKANERAAEANRIAEQERLARLKLEASLADNSSPAIRNQVPTCHRVRDCHRRCCLGQYARNTNHQWVDIGLHTSTWMEGADCPSSRRGCSTRDIGWHPSGL
jgi:hypothetical protein